MEKKFYEAPELEVMDMEIEGALLADSDPNTDWDMGGGDPEQI